MTPLPVVEDLQVVEDRIGQLDPGLPALAVNGRVKVPAGGQIKVPTPCGNSRVG
ncbi:MAG: hypothetical protein K2Q25_14630 [Mycobacteriaceae bacterium]|nr:hypothetical protein [Mycobacteriaceae bacterium]